MRSDEVTEGVSVNVARKVQSLVLLIRGGGSGASVKGEDPKIPFTDSKYRVIPSKGVGNFFKRKKSLSSEVPRTFHLFFLFLLQDGFL